MHRFISLDALCAGKQSTHRVNRSTRLPRSGLRFWAGLLFVGLLQIAAVQAQTITTVAGSTSTPGYGGDDGQAISASLASPNDTAVDADGNLYIADTDNNRIRKVALDGTISTVAGLGSAGFSGDGGYATQAQLSAPFDVAVDDDGNLYIADTRNHRIRKVTSDGTINTVAGNGSGAFAGDDGVATDASIQSPFGVTVAANGDLYIADSYNQRIRKVSSGIISTVVGKGSPEFSGDGGAATNAGLQFPFDVAVDALGNLYIADTYNQRVRRVNQSDGIINTVAGYGGTEYDGDDKAATSASLYYPVDVAITANDDLYIADSAHSRIRKVTEGMISTVAGNGTAGFSGDDGEATSASLNLPYGVAIDASGNLYIADTYNQRVRKVTSPILATPSLVLKSSDGTSAYGSAVTFTATIFDGNNPTGWATFDADGFIITGCEALPINTSTKATCTVSTLSMGTHIITATYSGDANNAGTSLSLTQTVGKAASITKVSSSSANNTSTSGSNVTFTATVSPQSAISTATPSGTVNFKDGSVSIPNCNAVFLNSSAKATCPTSTLTTGSHTITAVFSGDTTYNSSTTSMTQTVTQTATTSALSSSANPITYANGGKPITLTATVTGKSPTGTVGFKDNESFLSGCDSVALSSGKATCTTNNNYAFLTAGAHKMTVMYKGDTNNASSTSAVYVQTVNKASTTTALTSSASSISYGSSVTFTATVSYGDWGKPGGTVAFKDGSTSISGCSAVALDTAKPPKAVCKTSALSVGSHSITAVYSGDTNFSGSTSAVYKQTINVPMTVELTQPETGDEFPSSTKVNILATATTNTTSTVIKKVEFYINGVLKSTDTTASSGSTYSYMPTLTNGTYTLKAKATDSTGQSLESASVSIKVCYSCDGLEE